MKKIIFPLLLLCFTQIWAQSTGGFASVNFGTSRETVIEEIIKMGYDPMSQSDGSDRVVIPVYMMGELPVQVDFLFNKNDKFYSFEVRTGRLEAERLPKVFDALDYMSGQFALKYGNKYKITQIQEADVKPSVHNLYRQWFHKTLNVYTAIVFKDGRYYAIGSVTHRGLSKEPRTESKAQHTRQTTPSF